MARLVRNLGFRLVRLDMWCHLAQPTLTRQAQNLYYRNIGHSASGVNVLKQRSGKLVAFLIIFFFLQYYSQCKRVYDWVHKASRNVETIVRQGKCYVREAQFQASDMKCANAVWTTKHDFIFEKAFTWHKSSTTRFLNRCSSHQRWLNICLWCPFKTSARTTSVILKVTF